MSKISLKPNNSGTGVFTLEAPNSNVDRTLNLPDEAGTVLTNVSDIETQVKTATNATGSAPVYACRAWVLFNGTEIKGSGNVSSTTDNGTGDFTVNLTNAMPDINYAALGTGNDVNHVINITSFATSSYRVLSYDASTGSPDDIARIGSAIFR